jgi:hypothetical protein
MGKVLRSLPDETKITLLKSAIVFVQQHTTILQANFGADGDAEDDNDEDDEDDEDVDEEEASQRMS